VVGKPVGGADLKNGTVTLPILFACIDEKNLSESERCVLLEMVDRRFNRSGDCDRGLELLAKSDGISKSKQLISIYFGYCRCIIEKLHLRTNLGDEKKRIIIDAFFQSFNEFEHRKL
jgi:geranylgeranyl pyrophosphate synthase